MLSDKLHMVLADSYVLFSKTQNYHWNVEGPAFKSLHEMFEDQYNDLFSAIDVVAELIRSLRVKTNGSLKHYLSISRIKEGDMNLSAQEMVRDLLNDQRTIQTTIKDALNEAKKEDDEVVISFLADRLTAHGKNAWMLESTLKA